MAAPASEESQMPTTPNTPKNTPKIRISPRAERQRCMNELFETVAYIDPDTSVIYDPDEMPEDPDPDEEGNL
jgi:hypothetical protein